MMWTAPGQPTSLSTLHTAATGTESITTLNDLAIDNTPGGAVVDFYAIPYQAAATH
jgi:hypothetical protein